MFDNNSKKSNKKNNKTIIAMPKCDQSNIDYKNDRRCDKMLAIGHKDWENYDSCAAGNSDAVIDEIVIFNDDFKFEFILHLQHRLNQKQKKEKENQLE